MLLKSLSSLYNKLIIKGQAKAIKNGTRFFSAHHHHQ